MWDVEQRPWPAGCRQCPPPSQVLGNQKCLQAVPNIPCVGAAGKIIPDREPQLCALLTLSVVFSQEKLV